MTLAEAGEIFRYWQTHPPVHLLVAAALGVKPRRMEGDATGTLPAGLVPAANGDLGMPAPELSVAAMRARNRARAAAIARRNLVPHARDER